MTISEKLQTIAKNTQKVYEAGKKAEYDRFWDAFQENGSRNWYAYAFRYKWWNDETFKPKYDIAPTENNGAIYMFDTCRITNFKQILEQCGVKLNLRGQTSTTCVFYGAKFITELPILDVSNSNSIFSMFYNCLQLRSIDKLILTANCTNLNSAFYMCESLENITIEGVIVRNIDLSYSPLLTRESLLSIINRLNDLSGTTTTYTCTLGSINLAKLTDAEIAIATEKGWNLA